MKGTKESYIDSELFRILKNLKEKGFSYNNSKLLDVKFHEPADSGEADIVVIGEKEPSPILLPAITWKRIPIIWNKAKALATHNFYEIKPKNEKDTLIILALLNSSLSALFMELYGRTPLGEGALEIMVYEVAKLPVINVKNLNDKQRKEIEELFLELCDSQNNNNLKLEEKIRNKLDKTIFNILSLNEEKINEFYEALNALKEMREKRKETKIMVDSES